MAKDQSTTSPQNYRCNPKRKPQELYDKLATDYLAAPTSLREVARRNGCGRSSVLLALREHGIEPRHIRRQALKAASLLPFPEHLDRETFGYWLSGFVDGEGCFLLNPRKTDTTPIAALEIGLREDDRPILEIIRSFFGAGSIYHARRATPRENNPHHNSYAQYQLCSSEVLATVVIPHFERCPLLAKKRHDFAIWKQGVLLVNSVCQRAWTRVGSRPANHPRGRFKWTEAEIAEFDRLADALKRVRHFGPSDAT